MNLFCLKNLNYNVLLLLYTKKCMLLLAAIFKLPLNVNQNHISVFTCQGHEESDVCLLL